MVYTNLVISISTALLSACLFVPGADAARQAYDVRKIIEAFRHPRDDLTMLCAHRGLRLARIITPDF